MSVEMNFDATTVAPSTGEFEPIPNGTYPFAVVASESKVSDDKTKMGLKLTLQVLDGEYKGRKMTTYLNLTHPNPVAQELGQKELSAICHVTNVMKLTNSQQLHDIPFKAKIRVTPKSTKKQDDGTTKEYGEGNAVQQYLRIDGTPLSAVPGGQATKAAAPVKKGLPWAPAKSA